MGRLYVESLVVLTLTELLRHHSAIRAPIRTGDLPSGRIRWIVDYIEAHVGEDLSLLALSREAGVSAAHLARQFKKAQGRTVHQYVMGRRLEWAAALLHGTEQSIADIALSTGFYSQSHLTTAFHHQYSTTPAAHRHSRNATLRRPSRPAALTSVTPVLHRFDPLA
jgi:AraC-like DNA-binding protein